MSLRVMMLGGLRISSGDVEMHELVRQPQRCALLVYLAIERSASRQQLVATLWPDASDERGRHVLSQTLYQLRATLGQDVVLATGDRLGIAPDVTTDAGDFVDLIGRGDTAAAIALYRGGLFEGVQLNDTPAFENWIDGQRARLGRLHRTARRSQLEECSAREDWGAALNCARDWVRVDPQEDEAQHRLIELLALHGSRAEALQQYDVYVRSLRELELDPLPETVALAAQLRAPREPRQDAAPRPVADRTVLAPLVDLFAHPSTGRQIIGLYLAAAWFIIQFAATVFPLLGFPSWATVAVAMAGSGFPIALYFAWRSSVPKESRLGRAKLRPGFVHTSIAVAVILGSTGLVTRLALWRDADPEVVAIFPFRVISSNPVLKPFREGMVDALARNGINGDAGLHAVEPARLLSAWRREGGSDISDLTPKQHSSLARRLQASMILTGEIVETPNQVTLQAELTDAKTLKRIALQRVTNSLDSMTVMIDRLSAQLLSEALGQEAGRVASLGQTPLPAVTAYLRGVALSRAGVYNEAVTQFEKALSIDSTFALAAMYMIDPAGWSSRDESMRKGQRIAYQNRQRLSERDRAYLIALRGTPDSVITIRTMQTRIAASLRATQVAPDMPEVWYQLGDIFAHAGVATDYADPDAEAERYFRKAVALDPAYHAPLEHLIEFAHDKGDTAAVRKWLDLYYKSNLVTDRSYYVLWRAAHALNDQRLLDSLRQEINTASNPALGSMAGESQRKGFGFADAERALEVFVSRATTPAEINDKTSRLEKFLVNTGRPQKALALLRQRFVDRPGAPGFASAALGYATFGEAGIERDTVVLRAAQQAAAYLESSDTTQVVPKLTAAILYVAYQARHSTADNARASLRQLAALLQQPHVATAPAVKRLGHSYSRALALFVELHAGGAIDAREVTKLGEELKKTAPGVFGVDELILIMGELYLHVNSRAGVVRFVTPSWAQGTYAPARLVTMARAAQKAGDHAAAARHYKQLLAMREGAEPSMKPWRDQINAEYRQVNNQRN